MKHSILLLLIPFFSFLNAYGQEENLPKNKLTFGYFGETVTHSGLSIGIEHYPFQTGKYQIILASNIGGFVHKRNNTSLFVRGQWGQRIAFGGGVFLDQFIGLGYLHHFTHGGGSYEVLLPNGAVVETPNSGRPMVMPSISLGTGYDFSRKTKWDVVFFLRPELFWKAPFNGYYLTHLALNTGVIFNLRNGHEK